MSYFKTEAEVRAAKASVLADYQEQRQRLALLQEEAIQLSRKLDRLTEHFTSKRIDTLAVASTVEDGNTLTEDLNKTHNEVERLEEVLKTLGHLSQ